MHLPRNMCAPTIHLPSRRGRRKTQRNLDRGFKASEVKAAEFLTVMIHLSICKLPSRSLDQSPECNAPRKGKRASRRSMKAKGSKDNQHAPSRTAAAAAYSHPHPSAFSFQEKDIGLVGSKARATTYLNLLIKVRTSMF